MGDSDRLSNACSAASLYFGLSTASGKVPIKKIVMASMPVFAASTRMRINRSSWVRFFRM
ncbi:hypothetical protein D3C84_1134450 [compost metagenome]